MGYLYELLVHRTNGFYLLLYEPHFYSFNELIYQGRDQALLRVRWVHREYSEQHSKDQILEHFSHHAQNQGHDLLILSQDCEIDLINLMKLLCDLQQFFLQLLFLETVLLIFHCEQLRLLHSILSFRHNQIYVK